MLSNMNRLDSLPDEILLTILKNLDNISVLYSLFDVSKRLNRIVYDPIFTRQLSLVRRLSNGRSYSLSYPILDRFCFNILPKIDDTITHLDVEPSTMKSILRIGNYPNLCKLGLYNVNVGKVISVLADLEELIGSNKLKTQICSLQLEILFLRYRLEISNLWFDIILAKIFSLFSNLKSLNFEPAYMSCFHIPETILSPTFTYSTLLEFYSNVVLTMILFV